MKISSYARWIDAPLDNFMIRLGYLKYLAYVSSNAPTSFESLTRRLVDSCTSPTIVDLSQENDILTYIKKKNLYQKRSRYSILSSSGIQTPPTEFEVEIQDFYLSDPSLPSNLGAVSRDVLSEIVQWGAWLGVIHSARYSHLSYGSMILALLVDSKKATFENPDGFHNPFRIDNLEKYVFLYLILDNDGELLRHLIPQLHEQNTSSAFTRLEAVQQLRTALNCVLNDLKSLGGSGAIRAAISVRNLIDQLDKEDRIADAKRPLTGIMRISPRLENLVDLGLITKPNKFTYEYVLKTAVAEMIESLPVFYKFDEFLQNSFFGFASSLFKNNSKHTNDPDVIYTLVKKYHHLLGGSGYKRMSDLTIIVSSMAIQNESLYFEIHDLERTLEDLRKGGSKDILISGGKTAVGDKYVMLKIPR